MNQENQTEVKKEDKKNESKISKAETSSFLKNLFQKYPWIRWIVLAVFGILMRFLVMSMVRSDGYLHTGGLWIYHQISQDIQNGEQTEKEEEGAEKPIPF